MTTKTEPEMIALYEAALKSPSSPWKKIAAAAWTASGLGALIVFSWAEPWSARALARTAGAGAPYGLVVLGTLVVMALRAVVLVESFGYVYHRFFQHVGRMTRQSLVFRRNQMFHWVHHMIIYPIGRAYRRDGGYVASEDGVAWSWVAPGVIAAALWFGARGVTLASVFYVLAIAAYAKLVIDTTHSRFHLERHPWTGSRYFHWLEEIHLLHHWDQRYNFTIVLPAMDVLFGTYLAPRAHRAQLAAAQGDQELTVSDLINWRYLLLEATPAEYAAFISQAHRHARSLKKIRLLLEVLRCRRACFPEDREAAELERRANDLLAALNAVRGAAV